MLKRIPVVASMLSLATVTVPVHALPTRPTMVHAVPKRANGPKSKPKLQSKRVQYAWIPMTATWYDGQEGINGTGTGITKSGAHVQAGVTIAVDPKLIPLGSHVEVRFANGTTHEYIAEDTGSDIQGRHIDIYNPSRKQCLDNGVQDVSVKVEKKIPAK